MAVMRGDTHFVTTLETMTPHPTGDPLGLRQLPVNVPGEGTRLGSLPSPDPLRAGRWRGLWAWSATSAPVALLLTAGIAVAPTVINLLSEADGSTLSILSCPWRWRLSACSSA